MKKRFVMMIMMISMLLLSGCGELTLEEKMEQVQKANTITVQDVIDLMELEGLQVETVSIKPEFHKYWPGAVIVSVNDSYYVALKSFDENLWEREKAKYDIGWVGGFGGFANDINAVQYIGHNYMGYEAEQWVSSSEYYAKNLVSLAMPVFPANVSELSVEEYSAVIEELSGVASVIQRVFYKDINGMIQDEVVAKSENFTITGTLSYYATGVVDEKAEREWTYYDARTWFDGEIACSDAIWEQYEGEAYRIDVEYPDQWKNSTGSLGQGGILMIENQMSMPNFHTNDILWSAPEEKPIYTMTITIGDITETFHLKPEI
ncbi:MAG: hypothetical protein IJF50_08130 [Peptococcaceae bacterium]|nr:hypothetical protein [Peptococcaceae bacterium]